MEHQVKNFKVRTICGSSGGVTDIADVTMHVTAPGCSVDYVARLTEAAPELLSICEIFMQLSNDLSVALTDEQVAEATAALAAHATQVRFVVRKAKGVT